MNKILWPILLALTLSACGTKGGTQATVEDRTGGTAGTASSAQGTETTGVAGSGVAGSAVGEQYAGDPRKDPGSPLSKRSVFFDFDRFVVKDEYRPMLEAHAGYLKSKPDARVTLEGNADERGSREYNLALGQKRAEALKKMLTLLGAREEQVEAVSLGEEKPRCSEANEACWSQNRRDDMLYTGEF